MDFSGKTIAIGLTGSIAAYKACDLIRELYRRNADRVFCAMTPAAQAFITSLGLQALSRHPVYTSELSVDESGVPWHIVLAQQADAFLVMPASADSIAMLAQGLAQDPVTTTAITFSQKPVLVAPAMNTRMWEHPLTRRNIEILQTTAGYEIIEPAHGHLACGETGDGHLAEMETILQHLYRATQRNHAGYNGVQAIVTAGGTIEAIDPVRFIANRSSGKMGLALADELYAQGAVVTLITTQPPTDRPYAIVPVKTATEMKTQVFQYFPAAKLLIMAAAVADYSVLDPKIRKLKREHLPETYLALIRNPDILAQLGEEKRAGQILVGFAAETDSLIMNARDKIQRKKLDAIVANDVGQTGIGFESSDNAVTLVFSDESAQVFPKAAKTRIARQILDSLHERFFTEKPVENEPSPLPGLSVRIIR